jgi:hypothetical protein
MNFRQTPPLIKAGSHQSSIDQLFPRAPCLKPVKPGTASLTGEITVTDDERYGFARCDIFVLKQSEIVGSHAAIILDGEAWSWRDQFGHCIHRYFANDSVGPVGPNPGTSVLKSIWGDEQEPIAPVKIRIRGNDA